MHYTKLNAYHLFSVAILLFMGGLVLTVMPARTYTFGQPDNGLAGMGGPLKGGFVLAMGGPGSSESRGSEDAVIALRRRQAVLARREEILKSRLAVLELEMGRSAENAETAHAELRRSRNGLVLLLRDQRESDSRLISYLRQLWDAQRRVKIASSGESATDAIFLSWPAEPQEGISAGFHDPRYEARFGITHEAIDIPIEMGSAVTAAADGVVGAVEDAGLGYNYVIVGHGGFATLYGHVQEFLVREGDTVSEGDAIALSGGLQGTPGAGPISTGPHVHFELIVAGHHVDPTQYLPYRIAVSE